MRLVQTSLSAAGGVRERPNRHDWKSCVGKLTVGSNPTLSASFGQVRGGSPLGISRNAGGGSRWAPPGLWRSRGPSGGRFAPSVARPAHGPKGRYGALLAAYRVPPPQAQTTPSVPGEQDLLPAKWLVAPVSRWPARRVAPMLPHAAARGLQCWTGAPISGHRASSSALPTCRTAQSTRPALIGSWLFVHTSKAEPLAGFTLGSTSTPQLHGPPKGSTDLSAE